MNPFELATNAALIAHSGYHTPSMNPMNPNSSDHPTYPAYPIALQVSQSEEKRAAARARYARVKVERAARRREEEKIAFGVSVGGMPGPRALKKGKWKYKKAACMMCIGDGEIVRSKQCKVPKAYLGRITFYAGQSKHCDRGDTQRGLVYFIYLLFFSGLISFLFSVETAS